MKWVTELDASIKEKLNGLTQNAQITWTGKITNIYITKKWQTFQTHINSNEIYTNYEIACFIFPNISY